MPKHLPAPPVYQKVKDSRFNDLAVLDFSQAFKSTQLGNTLCNTNPLQVVYINVKVITIIL